MNYHHFIESLEHFETDSIRVIPIQDICYSESLPDEILPLFADIIKIIQSAKKSICSAHQKIIVFGLQTVPFSIESDFPILSQRIYSQQKPKLHLCCCIQYVIEKNDHVINNDQLKESHSFIVDFTTGEVADADYYLSKLFASKITGHLYGCISKNKLSAIWPAIQHHHVN